MTATKCPNARNARGKICAVKGCLHFAGGHKKRGRAICACCVKRLGQLKADTYSMRVEYELDDESFKVFEDQLIEEINALPSRMFKPKNPYERGFDLKDRA